MSEVFEAFFHGVSFSNAGNQLRSQVFLRANKQAVVLLGVGYVTY